MQVILCSPPFDASQTHNAPISTATRSIPIRDVMEHFPKSRIGGPRPHFSDYRNYPTSFKPASPVIGKPKRSHPRRSSRTAPLVPSEARAEPADQPEAGE